MFPFSLIILCCNSKLIYVIQHPSKMKKAQAEIDSVLGQERTTFEAIKKLEYATELLKIFQYCIQIALSFFFLFLY